MADNKTTTPPARATTDIHVRYDIHNPTRAIRVIYDGIEGSQKPISLMPGETKKSVRLHEGVVKELRGRNKDNPDSDLVTKLSEPEKSDA